MAVTGAAILAAFQDQQSEAKLPPPYATPSSTNRPVVVTRPEGAKLQVPSGFQIDEYATGFQTPRFILLGPSNEILLSDSNAGSVYVLVDSKHNNKNPARTETPKC